MKYGFSVLEGIELGIVDILSVIVWLDIISDEYFLGIVETVFEIEESEIYWEDVISELVVSGVNWVDVSSEAEESDIRKSETELES